MEQRHAEYVEYYRVRAERAAETGLTPESAAVERERADAIASCVALADFEAVNNEQDFGTRLAIAQARDQANARLAHYTDTNQTVRAAGEQAILDALDGVTDVTSLMTTVSEIENRTSIALIVDGMVERVRDDVRTLESIEVLERADVPAEWRAKNEASVAETIAEETADFAEQTRRNREYAPDWELDYSLVWQDRHRRTYPVPDAVLKDRVAGHARLVGLDGGEG